MQSSKSNGRTIAAIGAVLFVALMVFWLVADTLFTVGIFVSLGLAIGGLILMMKERSAST